MNMPELPEKLKGWEITEEIGEGSYGRVYRIEKNGESCALKVIPFPHDESERKLQLKTLKDPEKVSLYFKSQAESCMKEDVLQAGLADCENIVAIHESFLAEMKDEPGWNIFIRMELLTDLQDELDMYGVDEKKVMEIGLQLSNALISCETAGIVHRDIKPENILVSKDGLYKLGDFGVARRMEHTVGSLSLKGTFDYMSPEVYHGQHYGNKADLYSLGMVLYKLLNKNRGPFIPLDKQLITFRDKEEALERRMKGEELPAPVDASPEMTSIIERLCAYDPDRRFASARELRGALTLLGQGQYVIPRESGAVYEKKNGSNRNRLGMVAAIIAAIIICGAAGVLMLNRKPADENATNNTVAELETTIVAVIEATIETEGVWESTVQPETANAVETTTAAETESQVQYLFEDYDFGKGITASMDVDGNLYVAGSGYMRANDLLGVDSKAENSGFNGFPWDTYSNLIINLFFEADADIAPNAFDNLGSLKKVEVTGDVRKIDASAFSNCPELEEVNLPESLETIGFSAFAYCPKLSKINIPEHTVVEQGALMDTMYVKNLAKDNNGFVIIGGVLISYEGDAQELVVPDTVKEIGANSFAGNKNLVSVTIPDSVSVIGNRAFSGCDNLTSVIIENPDCEVKMGAFTNSGVESEY